MEKLRYYLHILKGVRLSKFFDVIRRAHEKCGKSKFFLFFDILNCAVRYGAGYYDYLIFGFYDMNAAQRKTYVTRLWNKKLVTICNDPQYAHIFDKKNEFYARFAPYLGREYLDMTTASEADFIAFARRFSVLFAKPQVGESGKGIEKLKTGDFENLSKMYAYVKEKGFGTVEEELKQHEALAYLYPLSINSLRIVTLVAQGEAHCVYQVVKMGNCGKFVDNMENDGLCCPLDPETGKIVGVAHTSKLINYDTHPYTGVPLLGYQVPYVKEAIELCLKAAMEIPEFRYIGWDVCITPTGPAIIEGNDYPGYDFWQLPEHTPDKIGLLPYYQKMIPELK